MTKPRLADLTIIYIGCGYLQINKSTKSSFALRGNGSKTVIASSPGFDQYSKKARYPDEIKWFPHCLMSFLQATSNDCLAQCPAVRLVAPWTRLRQNVPRHFKRFCSLRTAKLAGPNCVLFWHQHHFRQGKDGNQRKQDRMIIESQAELSSRSLPRILQSYQLQPVRMFETLATSPSFAINSSRITCRNFHKLRYRAEGSK